MQDDAQNNNQQDNLVNTDDPIPTIPGERKLPKDHPAADSSSAQDSHEIYDEGISGAAEAEEPRDSAVKDYDPDERSTSGS